MDLYRYFHPHHNPRLRNTALRLQELSEMQLAAVELRNAVKRAEIRTENVPIGALRKEHFEELVQALDYLVDSFQSMIDVHPEDDEAVLKQLASERKDAPGWETWVRLVHQRLQTAQSASPIQEELSLQGNARE